MYTDGACLGNPGPGGWAWAVPGERFASGAEARATNQRMELTAVLEALRTVGGPAEVVSDSTYVVNCFRDRWWEGWKARGWLNKARQPVANRDLWEPLIDLYLSRAPRPAFRWVKGHGTDPFNDLVDRLAAEAARTQQGRRGQGSPDGAGAPDAMGAPDGMGAADGRVPDGFKLVVTGHRPPELGGYGVNPVTDAVRARLADILAAQRQVHPDLVVMTGLGLGAEQLGADAAVASGVPYVAVLPYPEPDSPWPEPTRRRFRELLAGAAGQVLTQNHRPDTRQQAGGALRRRDGWLARHADEAVVVWDGADEVVGRTVRSLRDALGEEQVWVIEPAG